MTALVPQAAVARCEHHWVSHHHPDFPDGIYWVQICSLCGRINGEYLAADVAAVAAAALRGAADEIYNGAGDPEQEFYDHGVGPWLRARADRIEAH